jgi:CDP-4-dehydro-6-deoxyglucose reductase
MADGRDVRPAAAIAAPASFEEPYEVVGLEHLTATIVELWLRPLGSVLDYVPGEYVLLADDRAEVPPRSFSVANAPRSDGLISLLVTRVTDGQVSLWVHDRLRVGQTVSVSGPYGTFVDDPTATAPALFLAAGSGLAPIRALVEAASARGSRSELTLIFSARTEADVIDRERFERHPAQDARLRCICTLTRGAGPHARGRIPALLPKLYADLSGHEVFIAGAPGFVRACAAAAEALGVRREHVHTEVFFVEPQPWTAGSVPVGQRP